MLEVGSVEAYPEQVEGRVPQRGALFAIPARPTCSRSSASSGTGEDSEVAVGDAAANPAFEVNRDVVAAR